jgi:hypothetical protein
MAVCAGRWSAGRLVLLRQGCCVGATMVVEPGGDLVLAEAPWWCLLSADCFVEVAGAS